MSLKEPKFRTRKKVSSDNIRTLSSLRHFLLFEQRRQRKDFFNSVMYYGLTICMESYLYCRSHLVRIDVLICNNDRFQ